MEFLAENLGTIIVMAVILVAAVLDVLYLRKKKKSGGGCTGDCSSCGHSCGKK